MISSQKMLREKRRYFIVGAFVIAAVLTPPDVISQASLAIPLMALYEGAMLFEAAPARLIGQQDEFLSSARLDNL